MRGHLAPSRFGSANCTACSVRKALQVPKCRLAASNDRPRISHLLEHGLDFSFRINAKSSKIVGEPQPRMFPFNFNALQASFRLATLHHTEIIIENVRILVGVSAIVRLRRGQSIVPPHRPVRRSKHGRDRLLIRPCRLSPPSTPTLHRRWIGANCGKNWRASVVRESFPTRPC